MRDLPLYVDGGGDDEALFLGDGEPPALLDERLCRCGARMHVLISPVTIGKPPLSSWDWLCRACSRRVFGGRWRSDQ